MHQHIKAPQTGQKIVDSRDFSLNVPDQPVIPYLDGDAAGVDIAPGMLQGVTAAVAECAGGQRQIHWKEVYAVETACAGCFRQPHAPVTRPSRRQRPSATPP